MRVKTDDNKLSQEAKTLEITGATTQTENDGHVKVTVPGSATGGHLVATFAKTGALTVAAGAGRFLMPGAGTILSVVAAVNTAPTGAALICDVNKNGTTIFTTQANRPSIAISAFATAAPTVPDVTSFAAGDYLSVDIDQVGSSVAGSDLVVNVVYTLS